jgi:RNA polymerase sigma-70 factor, ECF subfamily
LANGLPDRPEQVERLRLRALDLSPGDLLASLRQHDAALLRDLLRCCLWSLGEYAREGEYPKKEDAEQALSDFCIAGHLRQVAVSYKPGPQSFFSYLKLCLKRYCHKRTKRESVRRRREKQTDEWWSPPVDPEKTLARKEELARSIAALYMLGSVDRELLALRYVDRLTVRDAAAAAGISTAAAKVRIHRARKKLLATRTSWGAER